MSGACQCGSIEPDQMPAPAPTAIVNTIQSQRVAPYAPRSLGTVRGGSSFGRGRGASDRSVT